MATAHSRSVARLMISPSVLLLLGWMIIPLALTLYFSFLSYNLLTPGMHEWIGLMNYRFFLTDPAFFEALKNTLLLVGGVLLITVFGGVGLALLLDLPFWGQGVVRILVIAPFFVMPTVSALVWKNMFMNPVNGLFAYAAKFLGLEPIDFLAHAPLFSIVLIVAWQWLPFATLILLTALAITGSGAAGSGGDGRGRAWEAFYVCRAAASGTCNHGCHPDPNHLSPVDLRRNTGDDQRRTGLCFHQSHLSGLCPIAAAVRCGGRLRRRHRRRDPGQYRGGLFDANDR